ncbi:MAG: GH25 family lysozyme [Lachnospiraceae bacterium]|nr:GH25 family lysozyme [Lachnospiraceae bacterium]
MYKGVDVSQWQGTIDWKKVAAAGIQFAIIRCAKQDLSVDPFFEKNYAGAKANGLKVGAYKYSYATTVKDAVDEAWTTVNAIKRKQFEAKVWLDLEDKCQQNLDKELLYEIVKTWLEIVKGEGYEVGIYCNQYWYKSILTDKIKALTKNFWIAKWSDKKPELGELAWQYSSEGKVFGISGHVDMNYYYGEFDCNIADDEEPTLLPLDKIATEVINGKWGDGSARREALEKAGYDYRTVQNRVNELLSSAKKPKKTIDEVAREVINGKWGDGSVRREALEKAGYDYRTVQNRVNELLSSTKKLKKTIDEVAREVINGKWGDGSVRREALEKAGYDYRTVQNRVNELLK